MVDFLATLLTTLQQSNVQLAIFLNGSLEADRFQDWRSSQMHLKDNVRKVLRHVHKRGTPPPKAWWVPPCAIQTLLRYALRTLNCSVVSFAIRLLIQDAHTLAKKHSIGQLNILKFSVSVELDR